VVAPKRKCNLIVDSCCDLPADLVASFGVELIEFTFLMSDGEHLDDLGVSMPYREFYERMRKGEQPKTAQVPYVNLHRYFQRACQSGIPTVYLCFTAALSGTFDTALQVRDDLLAQYPQAELYVVDTKLPSAAEGLLVVEAMRQLDRGLTAKEMVAWAEEARYYVNGFFTLPDLESLRRGGRIPDMAAVAGSKLDIKPILTFDIDGRLIFAGVARGRKKSLKQLLQFYNERRQDDANNTIIIASADALKEQKSLAEHLLKTYEGKVSLWQTQIGPVIGSHVGPGMIALVFWGPDRRKRISLGDRIANVVSGKGSADEQSQ
jgi:DegV family protein with EDD domain